MFKTHYINCTSFNVNSKDDSGRTKERDGETERQRMSERERKIKKGRKREENSRNLFKNGKEETRETKYDVHNAE